MQNLSSHACVKIKPLRWRHIYDSIGPMIDKSWCLIGHWPHVSIQLQDAVIGLELTVVQHCSNLKDAVTQDPFRHHLDESDLRGPCQVTMDCRMMMIQDVNKNKAIIVIVFDVP